MKRKPPASVSAYLAELGAKGGQVKGKAKQRGDSAYYRELALRSAKVRRAKRGA